MKSDGMRPVIFLDIDGVVVTAGSLTEGGPKRADTVCVAYLNAIVEETDADVVISSSWRMAHSLDFIRETLSAAGFQWPERVVDITLHLHYRVNASGHIEGRAERSDEIRAWLRTNGRDQFVIIDDDLDAEIDGHFVRTRCDVGLMPEDVNRAIGILRSSIPSQGA